jgi:hypothetical protein
MADYIVIMERDNAAKDYQLIERLKSDLQKTCYRTIFYRQTETAFLLDPKGVLAKLPTRLPTSCWGPSVPTTRADSSLLTRRSSDLQALMRRL